MRKTFVIEIYCRNTLRSVITLRFCLNSGKVLKVPIIKRKLIINNTFMFVCTNKEKSPIR